MSPNQNIHLLVQALAFCDNPKKQLILLREIAELIPYTKRNELQELLRMITSTPDIDLQVKLFSILSAYVVSRAENVDVIVTYNSLYDKVQVILSGGLPRKKATMLNFLSAVVYSDEGDSRMRLSMHARNMIRVSGCLATMCDMFTDCMMLQISQYQDTWKCLCMCLSECCRGSEFNQSYCTHLVPMSIQRCIQGDKDVFLVLQGLLQNNERNTKVFLDSDGAAVFTSELLQHDTCMHLLDTVVQSSPSAAMAICNTSVVQHLRHFLHRYAPQSQLGQWASIVLYHIDSQVKVLSQDVGEKLNSNEKVHKQQEPRNESRRMNSLEMSNLENTMTLLQNVLKEVYYCRSVDKSSHKRPLISQEQVTHTQNNKRYQNDALPFIDKHIFSNAQTRDHTKRFVGSPNCIPTRLGNSQTNNGKDLSFTFLRNDDLLHKKETSHIMSYRNAKDFVESDQTGQFDYETMYRAANTKLNRHETSQITDECDKNETGSTSFNPLFMSTPKSKPRETMKSSRRRRISKPDRYSYSIIQTKRDNRMTNMQKKWHHEMTTSKETKQRSFGNRVFGAINESCTTIVKSVRNLFKSKTNDTPQATNGSGSNADTVPICSYSFTKYMRKRDAVEMFGVQSQNSVNVEIDENTKCHSDAMSCKTCNDTVSLRNKLVNNNYLKQTVKKLKLGINLYGCDFKRISKSLWPQDNYMTPEVLYNLYRKLIAK